MSFDNVKLFLNSSNEFFGKGVGFGVEEEVKDVIFLFQDSRIFQLILGDWEEAFQVFNHISMM